MNTTCLTNNWLTNIVHYGFRTQKGRYIGICYNMHIFWFSTMVVFCSQLPSKLSECNIFWGFKKFRIFICNRMGTRISRICWKMFEILEPKVDNHNNSVSRNRAILCLPWNITFLWRWVLSTFFVIFCFNSTKVKERQYFTM